MNQNICNICGANYEYRNGRWKCPACGAFKVDELSNEESTLLFNAAQKLRLCDFDEAEKAYSDIIEKFPENPNGYWGRLLSRYGIKYEEDFDGGKIPTCYAASIESVIVDKDYIKALSLADTDTKSYFEKQAQYIERVRKDWIERAKKEKPYDIFICYKESDLANGIDRTQDSIVAQDLYIHLTEQGYRVFFSRENLRDKIGEKYEPYIFNALSTANVMLVYGTNAEYIMSTWMKNEWTRYEKRMQAGEKKPNSLMVVCDGFSPVELPKVLSSTQCFDATKRSFYSDLDVVVKRIIKGEEKLKPAAQPEKKKSKSAPIAIALASVMIAVLLCIFIPNIIQGRKITQIYNFVYDIAVSSDSRLFDKNATLEVSELYNGEQYDLIVSAVEGKIQKQLTNIRILDISCSFEISEKVTVTMPVNEGINSDNFAVYYVSNTGNIVEECNSKIQAGYVNFETTHFSYYVFAEIVVNDDTNNTGDPSENVTISFDSNGGTGNVSSIIVERNNYFDMPANGFIREGYTFVGWSSTATGVEWEHLEGAKCKAPTSTTYYAIWIANTDDDNKQEPDDNTGNDTPAPPKTVNIMFDSNGGGGSMSFQSVTVGEQSVLNNCSFTYSGYTFGGWATSASGNVVYTDGAFFTANSAFEITLYAIWVPNSNSLIFNANGGSGSMESISIETNATITLPSNAFSKSGYTFIGWSDVTNGTVKYNNAQSFKMTSSETVTLYAVWSANTNSVILKANNGTNNETTVNIKTDESKNLPANTFTKVGYTFKGWSSTSGGSVEYTDKARYTMGDSSVTLYAIWEANTNTINFNANGGSGTMPAQQAKTDEKVNLKQNSFAYEGYIFAGWATSSSGIVIYADQSAYTMGSDNSYTLYAIWIKADYIITYNMNGGSNNINNPAGYDVTDATITFADPTRDGYTFLGWYTDAEFQNKIKSIPKGSTGNKTVYASWSANTNTITFDKNGGSGIMSAQQAKTDEDVILKQNTFMRDGYTFKGWSTSSGGTVAYTNKASYTMGTGATVTLYAIWEPNTNTINFNANGGSGTMLAQQAKTDEKVILKQNSFTRVGYTFKGWSMSIGGSVSYADAAYYTMGTNESVTLYAVWKANTNTINFNANGGNGTMSSQQATTSTNITLKQNSFKREGYTFKGWSTSAGGSVIYSDGDSYTMGTSVSATLYAVWEYGSEGLIYEGSAVVGYTGTDKNIFIPATYNGTTITAIGKQVGSYGFYNKTQIEKIVLPNTITTIGYLAFGGCSNLKEINLPSTIKLIHVNAFADCTSLKSIFIPISCTEMGSYVFAGCTNLTIYCEVESQAEVNRLGFWADNWNSTNCTVYWGAIRGGVRVDFDYAGATSNSTIAFKFVEIGKVYTLPVPTKTGYTFGGWYYGTTQITNTAGLTLNTWNISVDCTLSVKWNPASDTVYTVKHYQENANDNGYTLKSTETLYGTTNSTVSPNTKPYTGFSAPRKASVTILPDGSAVLEYYYTRTTHTITFVTNGGDAIDTMIVKYQQTVSVPNASRDGFTFGGWFTDAALINELSGNFSSDTMLYAWWQEETKPFHFTYTGTTDITITNYMCYVEITTEVSIPRYIGGNLVVGIADQAFAEHHDITSVVIPDSVQKIGREAFWKCTKLESICLPKDLAIIQPYTFYGCYSISNITIPDNVTHIGEQAFRNCISLLDLNIPDQTMDIGIAAFDGCDLLKTEKNGLMYISDWVVGVENDDIRYISFDEGTKGIAAGVFKNCTNISEVSIPYGVMKIPKEAFKGCYNLKSVKIATSVQVIGEAAFHSTAISFIEIPTSIHTIESFAFYGSQLEFIFIPSSVLYTGNTLFNQGTIQKVFCQAIQKPLGWEELWADSVEVEWGCERPIGDIWDGTTIYSFVDGLGTEQDPYLISSAEHLAYVATAVNQGVDTFSGKYLKLTTNVHLMNHEWTPIGNDIYAFKGNFDGGGYSIVGVKITEQALEYGGLFGYLNGGTIKNINVLEADIKLSSGYGGIICGFTNNSDKTTIIFENCHVEGMLQCTSGSYAGGIVGYCNGTVNACSSKSTIKSGSPSGSRNVYVYVGGIAGTCTTITNCYSDGSVSSSGGSLYYHNSYVGGIVGRGGTINNCYSVAIINAATKAESYAGGIAGSATTINNCFSAGNITTNTYSLSGTYGGSHIGRIVGEDKDGMAIANCYADSSQTCTRITSSSTRTGTTNDYGMLQFTNTLQSENFIYNILGWSSDVWQITEGGFPTLK